MTREFTAVIEKKGRWYVAWVEEIPGVNTQGKTLAEARRNLKEALQLIWNKIAFFQNHRQAPVAKWFQWKSENQV